MFRAPRKCDIVLPLTVLEDSCEYRITCLQSKCYSESDTCTTVSAESPQIYRCGHSSKHGTPASTPRPRSEAPCPRLQVASMTCTRHMLVVEVPEQLRCFTLFPMQVLCETTFRWFCFTEDHPVGMGSMKIGCSVLQSSVSL